MTSPTATTAPGSKQAGRLGLSQYLGYAGGDVANNLTFSLASMFLLLYYTDVAYRLQVVAVKDPLPVARLVDLLRGEPASRPTGSGGTVGNGR